MIKKKDLIRMYWKENRTLQYIGDLNGVSRERVRQIMVNYDISRDKKRGRGQIFKNIKDYFKYVKKTGKESDVTLRKLLKNFKTICDTCNKKKRLVIHKTKRPAKSMKDISFLCHSCLIYKSFDRDGIYLKIYDEYQMGVKNGCNHIISDIMLKYILTRGRIYQIINHVKNTFLENDSK